MTTLIVNTPRGVQTQTISNIEKGFSWITFLNDKGEKEILFIDEDCNWDIEES